jgi:monoamine oxidase
MTRRQFLKAGTGVVASMLFGDLGSLVLPSRQLQVVIVGAGLSGLCAAYELERRGHMVTILEAERSHIGGRVRTIRFPNGLYGEAGAMRIPQKHDLTRHYVKEFRLPLRRFVQSNPAAYYHIRGKKVRISGGRDLNPLFLLKPQEKDKTPDYFWEQAVGQCLKNLTEDERKDLLSDGLMTSTVKALDGQSLIGLCRTSGLSEEAIELLGVTTGQESLMQLAATEFLRDELLEIWSGDFHEIIGGTDRLPSAFGKALRSPPSLGCEVVRLEQDISRKRVAAIYKNDHGTMRRVEGDFLLCTIPFPVLGRLQVTPPFSGPKQRAIRELNYDSATKVLMVTKERFWEKRDKIFGGGTFTDLPSGMTWYPSDNAERRDLIASNAPGVLLASYTWGQAARRLGALSHQERIQLVRRSLSLLHEELSDAKMVQNGASWNWDTHPWTGGAFALFFPGQHSSLHQHIIAPEGHIFFAGEHVSLSHAWMQGALESALRAVREMLAQAGRDRV